MSGGESEEEGGLWGREAPWTPGKHGEHSDSALAALQSRRRVSSRMVT